MLLWIDSAELISRDCFEYPTVMKRWHSIDTYLKDGKIYKVYTKNWVPLKISYDEEQDCKFKIFSKLK